MSEGRLYERLDKSNWLSRIAAKFDKPLRYYLPLRQEVSTELDGYAGKYSQQ